MYLREDEHPCASGLKELQAPVGIPFVIFIEFQILEVQVGNHPASSHQGTNRTENKLSNKDHNDLFVCNLHKSRGFVSTLRIVALDFGVMPCVNYTTQYILGVLERHTTQ